MRTASDRTVVVIDEGTTSTRAVLFDAQSRVLESVSEPLGITTRPDGSVEQDPTEIWTKSRAVVGEVLARAARAGREVAAVSIATQRDCTILWDRRTGEPVFPMMSWQDHRWVPDIGPVWEKWKDAVVEVTGMSFGNASVPFHLAWIFDHHPDLWRRAKAGELLAGPPDTWLIWNLTGGAAGGRHLTSMSCGATALPVRLDNLTYWADMIEDVRVPLGLLPALTPEDGLLVLRSDSRYKRIFCSLPVCRPLPRLPERSLAAELLRPRVAEHRSDQIRGSA